MKGERQSNSHNIRETLNYWKNHPHEVFFRLTPTLILFLASCRGGRGQISSEDLQATVSEGFTQATEIIQDAQSSATALVGEGQEVATQLARTPTPTLTPTPNKTIEALEVTIESLQTRVARNNNNTSTPEELEILTPTPTETPLRFFVMDDNSVTKTILEDTIALLKEWYPEAEVVPFSSCPPALTNGEWSGGVADHTVGGSQSAGPKCVEDILEENPNSIIVGYTRGGREMSEMEEAGAVEVCYKPDPNCIIDFFQEHFPQE
jgi:hypothetical protein